MSVALPEPLAPNFPTPTSQIQALEERLSPISQWGRNYTANYQGVIAENERRAAEEAARLEAEKRAKELEQQRLDFEKKIAEYEKNLKRDGVSGNVGGGDKGDYKNWKPTSSSMYANAMSLIEKTGATGARYKVLKYAAEMLGTPYAWGGGGIGVRKSRGIGKGTENVIGVDCSGLTSYVYGRVGLKLPRHSNSQTAVGVKTAIKNAQPGDLVGWNRGGHVAIYAGNGYIIESPKPGGHVRLRKIGSNEGVYAVRLKFK